MKKAQTLIERLERISFPFLLGMKLKSKDGKLLSIYNQRFNENNSIQFLITKEKRSQQPIDILALLDYAVQGILTLAFLHKRKIAHGEISVGNIYVDDDVLKIGPVDITTNLPFVDVKDESEINIMFSQDIYNFGVVLYSLAELKEFTEIEFVRLPNG
ncbi:MAG: hypothetical protein EZS28_009112 [Streblomastix strix]|uniref:Protein kinase domain-containing protein n=1 Tax=Streblomastix strix TaxID=222440 RepID=A0A5J4WKB7_9EUKA|nr:MAG: hypothetical protein EZS28_009112 [Streblomastix strix]